MEPAFGSRGNKAAPCSELYGEIKVLPDHFSCFFRQEHGTPFINKYDPADEERKRKHEPRKEFRRL